MDRSDEIVTAWARLIRAGRLVLAGVEADLKAAGLPPLGWYDALLELRRAGPDGLRPVELEPRLLLAQHNVSRLADRLAAAGLVERAPCPGDRRGQMLRVTAEGRALQEAMWPVYRDSVHRHLGGRLPKAEAAALAGLLGRITGD